MSRRITAADVEVVQNEKDPDGRPVVSANVAGRYTTYVVDLNPSWADAWLCSCGRAPGCAHIRVTKAVVKL